MNVVSMDVEGVSVTIDTKVFSGYIQDSNRILDEIDELKKDYKELIDAVEETTKLPKKNVRKYLKARYNADTKAPKKDAELFEALDNAVDN